MRMSDVGWVWEGQGLDPGVHPSIFGVGEGATFFGLAKSHFLFHETTPLALEKLHDKKAVACDISKWRFRDCGEGGRGSEGYPDASLSTILAEAELVSRLSCEYLNVEGGFFDDMLGLMRQRGHGVEEAMAIRAALRKYNPELYLECVVYSHELEDAVFWRQVKPCMDIVSFWAWGYPRLQTLETDLHRCRELFEGLPVRIGCYLRDYPTQSPMPMDAVRMQWDFVLKALDKQWVEGYDILGAVLIDGQLEQARWIRDFIRAHS